MAGFRLSRKAKADLKSIARYTESRWGRTQRNHYILQFDQCFQLLAENPRMGQSCDEVIPGYRHLPQGSHVIFYCQATESRVDIIRILHKRMLPEEHL